MKLAIALLLMTGALFGQRPEGGGSGGGGSTGNNCGSNTCATLEGTNTFTGIQDASGAPHTLPIKVVADVMSLPISGCVPGEQAIVLSATLGQQIYENSGIALCTWTQQIGGGTGNAASPVTVTFSATPTFPCPSSSAGTITTFKLSTTLSTNITSSNLSGCTSGQLLGFILQQDGTGGRTVAMPTGFSQACGVSLTVNAETKMLFEWDGTNAHLLSCTSDLGPTSGVEQAAPGTPGSGIFYCWPDSTDHSGLECKANSSANVFKMVLTGIDINTLTGQVTATHLASALPLNQGGLGIATAPTVLSYIPVAGCNNATAGSAIDLPTANAPTPTCHGTTTTTGTLDFGDSANSKGTFEFVLPAGWIGSTDITLDWYTASTSVSGKWTLETSCKAANGDLVTSPTYNSAQTITTTSSGTANGLTRSTQTGVTMTGCSAGNIVILRVGRDVTDTSTVTHSLLGIELTLRVTPQA